MTNDILYRYWRLTRGSVPLSGCWWGLSWTCTCRRPWWPPPSSPSPRPTVCWGRDTPRRPAPGTLSTTNRRWSITRQLDNCQSVLEIWVSRKLREQRRRGQSQWWMKNLLFYSGLNFLLEMESFIIRFVTIPAGGRGWETSLRKFIFFYLENDYFRFVLPHFRWWW